MKYIVIGLGNFGRTISQELTMFGDEVIAVDKNPKLADSIKDEVATTYTLDASVEEELKCLPLLEADAVIVTIGSDFGISILIVALLKKNGVKHILARANNSNQHSILQMFNLDRIIQPEIESAKYHALRITTDFCTNYIRLDKEHGIYTISITQDLADSELTMKKLQESYNIKVFALLRNEKYKNILGLTVEEKQIQEIDTDSVFMKGDELRVIATEKDFRKFAKTVSR